MKEFKPRQYFYIIILTFVLFILFFMLHTRNKISEQDKRIKAEIERLRVDEKEKNQQKDSALIDIDSTFNNID
tara:strand:- start:17767 stop:17985 length:219 start_codon:yes stop_codon:yes gene_type:complete